MLKVKGTVVLFLVVSFVAGATVMAEVSADTKAEIREALLAYQKALESKDLDAVLQVYTTEPEAIILGTGPGERWVGSEEIATCHRMFFDNFDKETSQITWKSANKEGNVAWIALMMHVTDYLKNEKNEFQLNMTAVLLKQKGQWRITMFHFSNLTGPE